MKKSACQILFVAINILFLTFNLSAQTLDAPVKFRLVRDYLIIVPVQINDTETLEFLLDTGTNTSIFIKKLCELSPIPLNIMVLLDTPPWFCSKMILFKNRSNLKWIRIIC